jgi:hypothetical protein
MDPLIDAGCRIHVVMPYFAVIEDFDVVWRVPFYERLTAAGAEITIRNVYGGRESRIGPLESRMAWIDSRAVDDLRVVIEAAGIELHLVGDAMAGRAVYSQWGRKNRMFCVEWIG